MKLEEVRTFCDNTAMHMQEDLGITNAKEYMNKWCETLELVYQKYGIKSINEKLLPNRFEASIYIGTYELKLCFNISLLDQYASLLPVNNGNVSEWVDSQQVKYSREQPDDVPYNLAPIYIVDFPIQRYRWLVVDGNHRLCHARQIGIDKIYYKYFTLPMACNAVCGVFEQAFYYMVCEAGAIQKQQPQSIDFAMSHYMRFRESL
ncbi:MAG: hypothetical protein VB035_05565 [Candidatus Fimivivens sp.]|nr:hypothetical protein [Candidatus Fimivivens sp.]